MPLLILGLCACRDPGTFTQVVVEGAPCALTSVGEVACWEPVVGESDGFHWENVERTTSIAAAGYGTCGLGPSGLTCWSPWNQPPPSWPDHTDGDWVAFSLSYRYWCGLDDLGRASCFGDNIYGDDLRQLPSIPFQQVSVDTTICGLDWLGQVTCAYDSEVPPGQYDSLEVGGTSGDQICGLREGVPTCVGGDDVYDELPPEGVTFNSLDLSYQVNCGVTTDRELLCWGSSAWVDPYQPEYEYPASIVGHEPAGEYVQVAAQVDTACALNAAGCVVCWGEGDWGAPESDPLCVEDVLPAVRP